MVHKNEFVVITLTTHPDGKNSPILDKVFDTVYYVLNFYCKIVIKRTANDASFRVETIINWRGEGGKARKQFTAPSHHHLDGDFLTKTKDEVWAT